jgi:hypothetical protein
MSASSNDLKQFFMTNQLLQHDLGRIEKRFSIDLGRGYSAAVQPDEDYYPQIEQSIRSEAAAMAPHYEVFYSLEKSVKILITETLQSAEGPNWWDGSRIPPALRTTAADRQKREIDSGITPRSTEGIDFCTFGELGEIIKQNWDLFGSIFTSVKAVEKVMASLNTLRAPVAHCSPLADDEILRLRLTVRDWFRLME